MGIWIISLKMRQRRIRILAGRRAMLFILVHTEYAEKPFFLEKTRENDFTEPFVPRLAPISTVVNPTDLKRECSEGLCRRSGSRLSHCGKARPLCGHSPVRISRGACDIFLTPRIGRVMERKRLLLSKIKVGA